MLQYFVLAHVFIALKSLPKWRETHRAEKNDKYFDFKHLTLCVHVDISYIFT
jgi:hypothetical protein